MQVKEMMTPNPVTIGPEASIYEALLLMYEHDIRRLPVLQHGKLVGIVSDRDIKQVMGRPSLAARYGAKEEQTAEVTVREVMSQEVITVRDRDDLRRAIELMVEGKFSGLPVVNDARELVGVVSSIDVLRYTLDLMDRVEQRER